MNRLQRWWNDRAWMRRQTEFLRTGTRYYGNGGTIHHTEHVDVEIGPDGKVCAVWFRCQPLPFKEHECDIERALGMDRMYESFRATLHGVEIRDNTAK